MRLAASLFARFHRHRLLSSFAGLVFCLVAAGWWMADRRYDPARAETPFRVGFQHSPPYQYVTPNGSPTGPAIQVFTEACRRGGIPIVWVHTPEGPDSSLQSGRADLWPLLGDLPERRKLYYISDPWITNSFWMVSRESSGLASPKDTAGHTVWYASGNIATR